MPKVPGMMDPNEVANPAGLLGGKDSQPDATSIMMAASIMRQQGKITKGGGGTPGLPRRAKAPKGSGHTKPMIK